MSLTVVAEGTQAASVGTEHLLNGTSVMSAGTFIMVVDTGQMLDGDALELRVYKRVLNTTPEQLVYLGNFEDSQGDGAIPGASASGEIVKESIPVPSAYSAAFTLKQVSGTGGRNFPWQIVSL